MKYPIVTMSAKSNDAFTVVLIPNPNMKIDGSFIVTRLSWTNNNTGATGVINGNSQYVKVDGDKVLLWNEEVTPYLVSCQQNVLGE